MADTSLQDRLRESQEAFHGLLSLIPAKMYYGEEKSDQWMKKKQTKDQARAAKRGKYDPDSELNRSAKEELEERARMKRKLRELESDNESDDNNVSDASFFADVEKEKPLEGLKKAKVQEPSDNDEPTSKKVKVDEHEQSSVQKKKSHEPSADPSATPNRKMTKEEKKSAKKAKKEEKLKAKLEKTPRKPKAIEDSTPTQTVQESTEVNEPDHDEDMMPMDISGLAPDEAESTGRSVSDSPVFDSTAATAGGSVVESVSSTTSVSTTDPSSVPHPPRIKLPKDNEALKRLEAKLEALRAMRRGANEKQPRTRQELIEERREKQLKRKAHKREMRLKAKEEEDRKREEALASARNSPIHLPTFNDPDADRSSNHFAFGRLTFSDGALMSHDLTYEKSADAMRKGPSDPKTALAKLEAQKKRLASLDEDKRKEVLEKETWLAARRRAEGEKVHDNEALLKKAVKRKEKAKKKSEKEWKERAAGVDKAIKDRQRKREENLKKRRDEKGAKGKKKKGGPSKPKNRPGFEGSFGVKRK